MVKVNYEKGSREYVKKFDSIIKRHKLRQSVQEGSTLNGKPHDLDLRLKSYAGRSSTDKYLDLVNSYLAQSDQFRKSGDLPGSVDWLKTVYDSFRFATKLSPQVKSKVTKAVISRAYRNLHSYDQQIKSSQESGYRNPDLYNFAKDAAEFAYTIAKENNPSRIKKN
jgi:hypothetical protein